MSSLRHLWFDNRHLLGDAAGQRLLADLEALGPRPRETILMAGDRLATISLTLAQSFCRHAPAAWTLFGGDVFSHWVDIGERLAGEEPASREGATAYFAIAPATIARVGLETVAIWAEIGRDTLILSRRLGSQFLQASAPLLAAIPDSRLSRLRAWAAHGRALLSTKGWKGEFLAVSYFDAAAAALPVLNEEEMAAWATLGLLVQDNGPWTFYATLPRGFAELTSEERLLLLRSCQEATQVSTKATTEVFFLLPSALLPFTPPLRHILLLLFAPAVRTDPAAVPPTLPLLNPFVKSVALESRPQLCNKLLEVAQQFPAGILPLIRTLPRAFEEAGEQSVIDWLTRGLAIAAENGLAGRAFFSLESRTSVQVLHQSSSAVVLEEVQERLRKYIHMLSGTTVGIVQQAGLSYPPALEVFPLVADALPLPARVEVFPTYEDNFRLFRVWAVQQAGRREFGTYTFILDDLWPQLSPAVQQLMTVGADHQGGLAEYFRCFPHPEIVEALFLLLETERVNRILERQYRGLQDDLHWVRSLALPSVIPDVLRTAVAQLACTTASRSTVYDSARTAAAVYRTILSSLVVMRQSREPSSFEALFFEKLTGDALIDPELDDSPPPPEAPVLPQLELDPERDEREGGSPLSPEELKALIEAGVDLQIRQGKDDTISPQGLYISDLAGKLPGNAEKEAVPPENGVVAALHRRRERDESQTFFYDEWDYQIGDYRSRWCRLREIVLAGDAGEYFTKTLHEYATLTPAVKHEFQRIRPEQYRIIRGLEDGEEFDFNAVVTAASDLRAGISPSPKLYTVRRQTERDVAALFLLDMSASTDEPIAPVVRPYTEEEHDDRQSLWKKRSLAPEPKPRRIIDVTKEALVLMAEALEEIGDTYAIYGFSGQGKDNVEFYHVKSFGEALSPTVKGRIGAVEPKRSTRMGTAIRHSLEKLKAVACRVKLLVVLSDGFPQDLDYGTDRRSTTYGLRDTMTALREAERVGILTFCLTVDKAGHDYLRDMCESSRYLVLDDVASLPTELPKVYQRYIRPRG